MTTFRFRALAICACLGAFPVLAGPILRAPSGHQMEYLAHTVAVVSGQAEHHFQFLWPEIVEIDRLAALETTERDAAFFCQHFALPFIRADIGGASRIGISFADRAVPFGEAAPEATQVFESYAIINNTCEWEAF